MYYYQVSCSVLLGLLAAVEPSVDKVMPTGCDSNGKVCCFEWLEIEKFFFSFLGLDETRFHEAVKLNNASVGECALIA